MCSSQLICETAAAIGMEPDSGTPYSSRNEDLYGRKIRRVAGPAKAARGGSPPAPPPAQ